MVVLVKGKWSIVVVSVLVCTVLLVAGAWSVRAFVKAEQKELRDIALELSIQTGEQFAKELDLSFLPLFSIAQFATELDRFVELPRQIGPAYQESSLPFLPNKPYYRNLTGVCDDPQLVQKYNQIAENIKNNAGMDNILHNLQLAPYGTICLMHPANNTDDFHHSQSLYLDSTPVLGLDLLNEPAHKYIAQQAMIDQSPKLSIVGPTTLRQCPHCGLYFIVRLPIFSDLHSIVIHNVSYPRWGFATALIHWDNLVQKLNIREQFASQEVEFQLTRTDYLFDTTSTTTNRYDTVEVVLAESKHFGRFSQTVSTSLQTTNNEWVMTVNYSDTVLYHKLLWALAIVLPVLISVLVYLALFSRLKHAQSRLQSMAESAKVEVERNVTSYFAHELRNPLSAIDSALSTFPETSETSELLSGMRLCSRFMSQIMNNLLDVRKLEEGMMVLKSDPVCVSKLLQHVRTMNAPNLKPNVQFRIECTTHNNNADWVLSDLYRLQQVLTNIVSNAVKYTLRGSVTLSAHWQDDDKTTNGPWLSLACSDTGPGIPKNEQKALFNRFTTRGGAKGTGLGLAIAKNIVTLMGGTIGFESDPTVRPGTRCILRLPLPRCDPPDRQVPTVPVRPLREVLHILLVDDMILSRNLLKRRFEQSIAPNSIIVEASTGEEALSLCEHTHFDVIVVDQYMDTAGGVLLGTDTIIALRRKKNDAYIIGCSGNDLDDVFHSAGANAIWQKPMPSNSSIISQLRTALGSGTPRLKAINNTEKTSCGSSSSTSRSSQQECFKVHETLEV